MVFRVALSGDFLTADNKPAYPMFDLEPLRADPDIEFFYVTPGADRVMPAEGLEDADALILLAPKFTADSVPKSGRLKLVARFGVGYDTVDLDVCNAAGIAVTIAPDGVRRPVAVTVMTFLLALTSQLRYKDELTRRGPSGWQHVSEHMGVGLTGRTFGQLGIGNIGAEVLRLAKPFDMRCVAHDPFIDEAVASELGVELVSLEELFRQADFLSVSVPLNDDTRGLVNDRLLGLMKPTAYLINTARGPIVDQKALYKALESGQIAGAGLDVFEVEPAPADEPLLKLDNVILAPHSLCFSDECFAGLGAACVRNAIAVKQNRKPSSTVNRAVLDQPGWQSYSVA